MPHIDLPVGVPGIRSAFDFRPETAEPLCDLAEVLLRDENTLSRGERELIAAYVSNLNECAFCQASHSAFAAMQLDGGMALVDEVKLDPSSAPISDKLRALLAIAAKVQEDGRSVTADDVAAARARGRDRHRDPRHGARSPPPSACSTATSTGSPPGRRPIRGLRGVRPRCSSRTDTSRPPASPSG